MEGRGDVRVLVVFGLLLALLCATAFSVGPLPRARAGNMNLLYVGPSSQPSAAIGSNVTFQVKVSEMDPFNGWDILVKADPAVLNPRDFSTTPNVLTANFSIQESEIAHCVNGVGSGCDPTKGDGLGIVHSAVFPLGAPPAVSSVSGILFTVTYTSITNLGGTPISIIGQGLANGTPNPLPVDVLDGFYGSSPGFTVTVQPTSFTIPQGSIATGKVTVTSHNRFTGNVTFIGDQFLHSLVNPPIVALTPNATVAAGIMISVPDCISPGGVITGIRASSGSLSYTSYLFVTVTPSTQADFCVDVLTHNGLIIRAGSSNSSIIGVTNKGVTTPVTFVGAVSLSSYVLPQLINGPAVTLKPTIVSLSTSIDLAVSNLTVAVPSSAPAGIYTVVVNGTSGSLTHFAIDLVTVLPALTPAGPAPVFTANKLSWIHYLSLSRNGVLQSWSAHVLNGATVARFIQVVIRGAGGSVPFSSTSPVVMIPANSNLVVTFETPIPSSLVGSEICFTARLAYGDASNALLLTSASSKSGCFRVAP